MNVVKCKNGHFFDSDKYSACPHCGEIELDINTHGSMPKSPEKKALHWGKKEKTTTDVIPNTNLAKNSQESDTLQKGHTLDFWQTKTNEPDSTYENYRIENRNNVNEVSPESHTASEQPEPKSFSGEREELHDNSTTLKSVVQKASANTEGKTMSYFGAVTSGASNASAHKTQNVAADPVVGWLVCIHGNHFGESFNIGAGKNSIGRNEENKIILAKDNKVSRSKHALITYEPKKRNFYLQPGDSSGLTYLNDDYIDESKILSARDEIEMGDSKFIFVPLCDETFSWEDFLQKE